MLLLYIREDFGCIPFGGIIMAYISFDRVTKKYQMGEQEIYAARDVSFEIEKGEFCIIVGPSGVQAR